MVQQTKPRSLRKNTYATDDGSACFSGSAHLVEEIENDIDNTQIFPEQNQKTINTKLEHLPVLPAALVREPERPGLGLLPRLEHDG